MKMKSGEKCTMILTWNIRDQIISNLIYII